MTRAAQNAHKRRVKKTKTFTGCATCRSRKIKCDLGRPFCKRCEKSGLECAGYQINLFWSKPLMFDKYGTALPVGTSTGPSSNTVNEEISFQRRNIAFVKYDREYETYEEMDRDLAMLHSPDYTCLEHKKTWFQGPFGVFEGLIHVPRELLRKRRKLSKAKYALVSSSLEQQQSLHLQPLTEQQLPHLQNHEHRPQQQQQHQQQQHRQHQHQQQPHQQQRQPDFIRAAGTDGWLSNELRYDALLSATAVIPKDPNNIFAELLYPYNSPTNDPLMSQLLQTNVNQSTQDRQVLDALKAQSHTVMPLDNMDIAETEETQIGIQTSESEMPSSILEIIKTPVPTELLSSGLNIEATGLRSTSLLRFLVRHWEENVADLMTVIVFPSNPWKTIYFPRGLKALGDLTGLGFTSDPRNSLLNALLAVSCFHLQSKFSKGSKEMKFFLNLGIEFRLQASCFLKKLLNNEKDLQKAKYKDVITAILSMNTIDVVWGTMADCQYHLSICQSIILNRIKDRPKLSNSAKILHRIFSCLKLMQDSTNLKNNSIHFDSINDLDKTLDQMEKISWDIEGDSPNTAPVVIDELIDSQSKTKPNFGFLTDALYGLPSSLISVFRETVFLLSFKYQFEDHFHNKSLKARFDQRAKALEKNLSSWSNEWVLHDDKGEFLSDLHHGIHDHVMSFFHALKIYFYTMIENLHHSKLQSHVETCIKHLISLQTLINDKQVKITPLIWQGFIAGCSAVDDSLQIKFKDWSAELSKTGIGSYWGARQIMFEVWRRRNNNEENDNWVSVHEEWEMNLMLV